MTNETAHHTAAATIAATAARVARISAVVRRGGVRSMSRTAGPGGCRYIHHSLIRSTSRGHQSCGREVSADCPWCSVMSAGIPLLSHVKLSQSMPSSAGSWSWLSLFGVLLLMVFSFKGLGVRGTCGADGAGRG